MAAAACLVHAGSGGVVPEPGKEGGEVEQTSEQDRELSIVEHVRRQAPSKTPEWVSKIRDRIGDLLIEKHLCKDGPAWGLARRDPYGELDYEEVGSSTLYFFAQKYDLWDKLAPPTAEERQKALVFWQSWQDPETGLFHDPREPERMVNEKYVISIMRYLGGEPKYPRKAATQSVAIDGDGRIDTTIFLERTKDDPDWARGGWGVGSHTGFMAVEIFKAINEGQTELIPDLEKGLDQILSHQNPESGLWGQPNAGLAGPLGGALKLISRLYFTMGMTVPHAKELADTLIEHERNGNWFKGGSDMCVPQNVLFLVAYCLEVSDYRREDLYGVLESKAKEYRDHWFLSDGTPLTQRDKPKCVGVENVHLQALGIIAAYLNWEGCRLGSPLAAEPKTERGKAFRYRPRVMDDGSVKVVNTEE